MAAIIAVDASDDRKDELEMRVGMMKRVIALGFVAMLLAGCQGCSLLGTVAPKIPSEPFVATVCVDGAVSLPCIHIGAVQVPVGGKTVADLVLMAAGPLLVRTANLKGCIFQTFPVDTSNDGITVTATASCKLNGIPVDEKVTVTLLPVESASGAFIDSGGNSAMAAGDVIQPHEIKTVAIPV